MCSGPIQNPDPPPPPEPPPENPPSPPPEEKPEENPEENPAESEASLVLGEDVIAAVAVLLICPSACVNVIRSKESIDPLPAYHCGGSVQMPAKLRAQRRSTPNAIA